MTVQTYNIVTVNTFTYTNTNGDTVTVLGGTVVNTVLWDGVTPWTPPPYIVIDDYGNPVSDPQPTTAVIYTDPPIDPNAQPVVSQPGLISRILSALNPFK